MLTKKFCAALVALFISSPFVAFSSSLTPPAHLLIAAAKAAPKKAPEAVKAKEEVNVQLLSMTLGQPPMSCPLPWQKS